MKAVVSWTTADGTTQPMMIEGPYIVSQAWDSGRALVTVFDRQGGHRLRILHFAHASVIDIDRRGHR